MAWGITLFTAKASHANTWPVCHVLLLFRLSNGMALPKVPLYLITLPVMEVGISQPPTFLDPILVLPFLFHLVSAPS